MINNKYYNFFSNVHTVASRVWISCESFFAAAFWRMGHD